MFQRPPPLLGPPPKRKRIHQHHESKKWVRLPATERCLECFPLRKPFLETAFGKLPPEIRADIFKDVLTVGSISPLKDGISVPMSKTKQDYSDRTSETKVSIGPARSASCFALLQTCRQIYHESSHLFYSINTIYLSDPQAMLSFLRHLGPARCDELRFLHLEDVLVPTPVFSQEYIDQLRSQRVYPEGTLAMLATRREDRIHPDVKKAVQLLNKRGNMRKIYLDMRPSQTVQYINLCTQIPGCQYHEIAFQSPTRWSMTPSNQSFFMAILADLGKEPSGDKPYSAYWLGNEKYRVEVEILRASPKGNIASTDHRRYVDGGTGDRSFVDKAMENLRFF